MQKRTSAYYESRSTLFRSEVSPQSKTRHSLSNYACTYVIRYYVNGPIRSPTLLRNAHYIRQGKKLHRSVSNSV